MDNTKSFWAAHKQVYDSRVRAPMVALVAELEEEFGAAKVFRPHRDVRFAKDKAPYKTHQGAFVAVAPATGWYVEIAAPGVRVAAGCYAPDSERLGRIRAAIDAGRSGARLARILTSLSSAGWTVQGEKLKTAPRGYDVGHPRIDLLRHKSLTVVTGYGFDEVIHSPALLERVRADWRAARPLVEWLVRHCE